MKRFFTLMCMLFLALNAHCQSMEDMNKSHTHTVTYDEDFNPTLNLTVKNVFSKVITTLEVVVDYNDPYTWAIAPESRTVQAKLRPEEKTTIHIRVPKEKNRKKPRTFYISKVRFEDGSVCDK